MANHPPKWNNKARVALAEDPSIRGYIYGQLGPACQGDKYTYSVQWDKYGCFTYLEEALISEKEADEILAKKA